jgi:hypothetical protein
MLLTYQTKNTAAAAALVTFGIHVTRKHRENGSIVWELEDGACPCEQDVGRAFQSKGYSREPLAAMIKAANAREWLLGNVVHGQYEMEAEPDSFVTASLTVASCLVAENYYLRAFRSRQFYFAPDAHVIADKFKKSADGDDNLDWQRRYLNDLSDLLHQARQFMGR